MTLAELDAVEARAKRGDPDALLDSTREAVALVAEVRRLRELLARAHGYTGEKNCWHLSVMDGCLSCAVDAALGQGGEGR